MDVRTVHSLSVTWDVPTSGGLTEYTMKIQEQTGSEQTIQGSVPRIAIFTGLTAGTEYTVELVTLSGDQISRTVQRTFYTSKYRDV